MRRWASSFPSSTPASGIDDPLNWSAGSLFPVASTAVWNWEATLDIAKSTDFFEFLPAGGGGLEAGAFTISSNAMGVTSWLPVDVADFGGTTHMGDATLDQGLVRPASADEKLRGWTYRDDSTFFVNAPVPEASSIAIWGVLAGIGLLYRRSRM